MQPYNANPRQTLTQGFISQLLQKISTVQITYGADILDRYLNFVQDLTPWMVEGSTVSHDSYATICGTCSLVISSDAPLNILSQVVRPWQILTDPTTGLNAKFYLGVYTLTSPEIDLSTTPANLTYSGSDLLYFLDQSIGDAVQFVAGSDPISACITLIGEAITQDPTVNYTPRTNLLVADAVYPFDDSDNYTYLDVINDLLATAGYAPCWVDWMGVFQLQPFVTPLNQKNEWVFDLTSPNNIVSEKRTSDQDIYDVPNWWRFCMNGTTGSPVEGVSQYTFVDNSARPTSFASRGFLMKTITFMDVTDYPTLVQQATITIAADLSPTQTYIETTSPFPLAWHFDQVILIDPSTNGGVPFRAQSQSWQMSLDGSSDTAWVFETVTI